MKIGFFTDIHANLPALEKCIEHFQAAGCDRIIHLGDLIGIGSQPKECMELALSIPNMEFIMGNHDYWYGFGLPNPIPTNMSTDEVAHQNWTHAQIGSDYIAIVKKWDWISTIHLSKNLSVACMHYGLNEKGNWFKPHIKFPDKKALDDLFHGVKADLIIYGHNHLASDKSGRSRYINLGSAGCYRRAEARVATLEMEEDGYQLTQASLPYDDRTFLEAFESRKVPAREFILKNFITRIYGK